MSTLVEIPPDQYSATAFANFNAAMNDLNIGNARAMMWMSQLAYETGRQSTIDAVAPQWGFVSVVPFVKLKTDIEGSFDTTGLLGERADCDRVGLCRHRSRCVANGGDRRPSQTVTGHEYPCGVSSCAERGTRRNSAGGGQEPANG